MCRVPEDKLAKVMPEIEEEDAEDRGLSVTSLMLGANSPRLCCAFMYLPNVLHRVFWPDVEYAATNANR